MRKNENIVALLTRSLRYRSYKVTDYATKVYQKVKNEETVGSTHKDLKYLEYILHKHFYKTRTL